MRHELSDPGFVYCDMVRGLPHNGLPRTPPGINVKQCSSLCVLQLAGELLEVQRQRGSEAHRLPEVPEHHSVRLSRRTRTFYDRGFGMRIAARPADGRFKGIEVP